MLYVWPPDAIPKLVKICGRNEESLKESARRYGYADYSTDWRDVINDDRIQIVENLTPNYMHPEPCIEAAKAGKHVICEKPLAVNAQEAKRMLDAVNQYKVENICCYNYRMVPAILLAKKLIEDGKLGKIYHFRAKYLQEWIADTEFPMVWRLSKDVCGSGALGDLGSHIIDLGRFLCGEFASVMASSKTFISEKRKMRLPAG